MTSQNMNAVQASLEPLGQRSTHLHLGSEIQVETETTWRRRLQTLVARHSGLGIEPDLPCMTQQDAWGLFRRLSGLDVEGSPA